MVGLIYVGWIERSPFVKRYTDILDSENIQYEIINWNRYREDSIFEGNIYTYGEKVNHFSKLASKIKPMLNFRKYVKGIIGQKQYDKLVILTTQTAILFPDLISKYKANDSQYGYNIEYGGCHNGKTSEQTKRKISMANKGKRNSPQTEFKKGHKTIFTKDMREKISRKNKGRHASIRTEFKKGHKSFSAKKVLCIETNTVYNTIKEAGEDTSTMACHISEVCKNKRKSAGGLHWKYL